MRQAGSDFALHLMLDVQQWDYGALGSRAGLMVFIHDHETPPLVAQLGFAVGPGTSTFAAINKQKVTEIDNFKCLIAVDIIKWRRKDTKRKEQQQQPTHACRLMKISKSFRKIAS